MNTYMAGSLVRSIAKFADINGNIGDPTTITLKYKIGIGSTTTVVYPSAPIVKDSTGVYHADFDTTGWAGATDLVYTTEWSGTGTIQAIATDSFQVDAAPL